MNSLCQSGHMLVGMLFDSLHPTWQRLLDDQKSALVEIEQSLAEVASITPDRDSIMRAFASDPNLIKVLVIGQDPYPSEGVATGLAFAVNPKQTLPASLKNLMRELASDYPECTNQGDLSRWSERGVMLLNTSLTTVVGQSGAHTRLWREFTQRAVSLLAENYPKQFVVLALGSHAQQVATHCRSVPIISAAHPSPLSAHRGFFGSRVFTRVNQELKVLGQEPIDWSC